MQKGSDPREGSLSGELHDYGSEQSAIAINDNGSSSDESRGAKCEAEGCEGHRLPQLQTLNFTNSNDFVGADCESAFATKDNTLDCPPNENSQLGSSGESIKRIIMRLKQSATEVIKAMHSPEEALNNEVSLKALACMPSPLSNVSKDSKHQWCDQTKSNAPQRRVQCPFNMEAQTIVYNPSTESNRRCGQFGPYSTCDQLITPASSMSRENTSGKAALPACKRNCLSSADETMQSLRTAACEIEKVMKSIGASTVNCPAQAGSTVLECGTTTRSASRHAVDNADSKAESSPYSPTFLDSPQLRDWIELLQNLARCMQPNAQFPNSDLKCMIMCTVNILQDIQKSMDNLDSEACTVHELQQRTNGQCNEFVDKSTVIRPNEKELTGSLLLCRLMEIFEKLILSMRPNAAPLRHDLGSSLSCSLSIIRDIIQTECLESRKLQTIGKILKCLQSEICRQVGENSDILPKIREIQEILQILDSEAAIDRQCVPTQHDMTLQKTTQLSNIIMEIQKLLLCSRPDVVFPDCDVQSTIICIMLFLKDNIQSGILNVSTSEKVAQQLQSLEGEILKQGLHNSRLIDSICEVQQYIKKINSSRAINHLDPCRLQLKETPILSKIVVILQRAIQHIKDDANFPTCDLELRILGLLKMLKGALQLVRPDDKVLKRLEKIMRCLECEVSKQGLQQSDIGAAVLEVQQILLKLQDACDQGLGAIKETPQLNEVIAKLREFIQCMTPNVCFPENDTETMVIALLNALKKVITPTSTMPDTVERVLELLKVLECEVRNQGVGESKVSACIHEIQCSLAQITTSNAPQIPSNESIKRALNALVTANTCIKNLEHMLCQYVETPPQSKNVPVGRVVEYSGTYPCNQEEISPPSAEAPLPVEYTGTAQNDHPFEHDEAPAAADGLTVEQALNAGPPNSDKPSPSSADYPDGQPVEYSGTSLKPYPFTHDEWQIAEANGTIFSGARSNNLSDRFAEPGVSGNSQNSDNSKNQNNIHEWNTDECLKEPHSE
uniref:Uncharacterized protein n=1 Tax=Echinococcus granulosus TaxID=6210 RepID=A0A068WX12_ECHGR|nr:hypothetical protein EgrG_000339400 [Echinococcus granulosus]